MSIISNAKEIAELVEKIGDIDLYRKILKLEDEITVLTREKRALEEKIEQLKSSLELSKHMTFIAPAYFAEGNSTPFCPKCWEVDKMAVHLIQGARSTGTYYSCPKCRQHVWISG